MFSVLYCVFLFLVINRSVTGVVCPVAGARPVAGVIFTVVEENHPVAVVACPAARVTQNCVAQVTSKSTVIGSLVDCPFACRIVADHSLMSGVMHSLAGIMDCKVDSVQSMACLFTIHAAVWTALHMPVDVYIFRYRPAHKAFVDKKNSIIYGWKTIWKRDLSLPLHGHLHDALCSIHEANCGLGVGGP